MAHIQTESEWQEEMSAKIVEFVRHELYMELRYLKLALSQLQLKSDPDLRAFATDGAYLYVAPEWLIGIFEKNAQYLGRAYLHTVLHCIFSHLWIGGNRDRKTVSEINNIISELSQNSEKSMELMKKMSEASDEQVAALESTQQMFEDLKGALDSCMASIQTITGKIKNVNSQRELVTESIDTLTQLATDNASSTEETSAMATELDAVVRKSSDLVSALADDIEKLSADMKQFKL